MWWCVSGFGPGSGSCYWLYWCPCYMTPLSHSWANCRRLGHNRVGGTRCHQLWLWFQLQLSSTELPNHRRGWQVSSKFKMSASRKSNCAMEWQQWNQLGAPLGKSQDKPQKALWYKCRKESRNDISRKVTAYSGKRHSQQTGTFHFGQTFAFVLFAFLFLQCLINKTHCALTLRIADCAPCERQQIGCIMCLLLGIIVSRLGNVA